MISNEEHKSRSASCGDGNCECVCVSERECVCFLSMYPMNTWVLIGAPGLSDPF